MSNPIHHPTTTWGVITTLNSPALLLLGLGICPFLPWVQTLKKFFKADWMHKIMCYRCDSWNSLLTLPIILNYHWCVIFWRSYQVLCGTHNSSSLAAPPITHCLYTKSCSRWQFVFNGHLLYCHYGHWHTNLAHSALFSATTLSPVSSYFLLCATLCGHIQPSVSTMSTYYVRLSNHWNLGVSSSFYPQPCL